MEGGMGEKKKDCKDTCLHDWKGNARTTIERPTANEYSAFLCLALSCTASYCPAFTLRRAALHHLEESRS